MNQFDLIRLAMHWAAESFGSTDGTFNAASFSQELTKLADVKQQIDGRLVAVILCGRGDVEQLSGGSHYRLIEVNQ